MKRWIVAVTTLALVLAVAVPSLAQGGQARLRVVQASPDAPALDVSVNDNTAFPNLAYKDIADYQSFDAGSTSVKAAPVGDQTAVIDVNLDLQPDTDYTVVVVGTVDSIEPLVLVDDNTPPGPGQARVRFVHASPDAPAVNVGVEGGQTLFNNVAFKGVGNYVSLPAGTVTLEARDAGTNDVVLTAPDVALDACKVYTVYAVGLAGAEPPLEAITSTDAETTCAAPPAGATPTAGAAATLAPTVVSTPGAVRSATPGGARTGTPSRAATGTVTKGATGTVTKGTTGTVTKGTTGTVTKGATGTGAKGGLTRIPTKAPTSNVGVKTAAPKISVQARTAVPTVAEPPGGPPLQPPPNQ